MRALVVFGDPEDARYQWLLKPGFRHVFCCLDDGQYWIMVDGRDQRPVFQAVQGHDYDLAGWFRKEGHIVIEMEYDRGQIRSPLIVSNCVGIVKAALCLHAPFVWTPLQLYRHLRRMT